MKMNSNSADKALEVLLNQSNNKLLTEINSCVRCGLCAESCMYYLITGDEKFIPARKVNLISSIYNKYCTTTGKLFPYLQNAKELNDDTFNEMIDLLYGACTLCGRCTLHCSIGIDITYLVKIGRSMLAAAGKVPQTLQATVDAAVKTGNNMAIPTEELLDTIKWLEEELQDELNDPEAKIPLNQKGKNILYTLNPREPKFFPLSISAMAKIFHAAGESWTLSTNMYDVTNYAYFSGSEDEAVLIADRLYREMKTMEAKRCVLAECGHGSRAFRWEGPNYLEKQFDFDVLTSVELIAEYIKKGKLKIDRSKIKKPVTLHDPCNLVREGGIIYEQRFILNETVSNFIEMTPHGIDNFCCGGGGGQLSMSEYNERRMKIAEIKADQIRRTGASIVVTPCHNCIDQLIQINSAFKLGVEIKTLAEIVADSIVLEKKN